MYDSYVGTDRDWMAVAESVASKLETAMIDGIDSGELSRVLIHTAVHMRLPEGEEVKDRMTLFDNGDSISFTKNPLVVNYHTVKVQPLSALRKAGICIQWFIRDYNMPVAEMLVYINSEAVSTRYTSVLENVSVVDTDGDVWTLDDWYGTWIDREQEQDITDFEAEDLES